MIIDQKNLWNKGLSSMANRIHEPSDFALEAVKFMKKGDNLLELGCGLGLDAQLFANHGVKTIATDFANKTIAQNIQKYDQKNLTFELLDSSMKYPYQDNYFDFIYACLSLHYFTQEKTKEIFSEIRRVLKPKGLFAFRCKSTKDPYYGKGEMIEKDMFMLDGHVRHLFSLEYAKSLLSEFSIVELNERKGEYDGETSMFIDCVARKK